MFEPCRQPVDRERVSQIVNPRLVTCFVMAGNARFLAHSLKGLVRRIAFDLLAVFCQKEVGIMHRILGRMVLSMVSEQDFVEIRTKWNFTGTIDTTAPNVDASPAKIHVFALQLNCLSEHGAGGIKKQEQRAKGARINHAVELALHSAGGHE